MTLSSRVISISDHLPLRDVNARLMSEISRLEGEKNAGEVENAKKVSAVDQLVQFNDLLMKENEIKTGFVNVEGKGHPDNQGSRILREISATLLMTLVNHGL